MWRWSKSSEAGTAGMPACLSLKCHDLWPLGAAAAVVGPESRCRRSQMAAGGCDPHAKGLRWAMCQGLSLPCTTPPDARPVLTYIQPVVHTLFTACPVSAAQSCSFCLWVKAEGQPRQVFGACACGVCESIGLAPAARAQRSACQTPPAASASPRPASRSAAAAWRH